MARLGKHGTLTHIVTASDSHASGSASTSVPGSATESAHHRASGTLTVSRAVWAAVTPAGIVAVHDESVDFQVQVQLEVSNPKCKANLKTNRDHASVFS